MKSKKSNASYNTFPLSDLGKQNSKTLSELLSESNIGVHKNIHTIDHVYSTDFSEKKPAGHAISDRLEEITSLIRDNSLNRDDFKVLEKNQEQVLGEIKLVQKQNDSLLKELSSVKNQNFELKKLLLKNTTDKRIRSVSVSFLLFFTVGLFLFYFKDYEIINIGWAKIGFSVSLAIYLIGFFIGRMMKNLKV